MSLMNTKFPLWNKIQMAIKHNLSQVSLDTISLNLWEISCSQNSYENSLFFLCIVLI
ncbi:hypothetical protein psyc5s11_24100 [Clostridium gelidum]|uniref:Uncharacterized protein n=1 Tax=Clostridium gelidum TaxID=704125 RepID=A0ABM7T329_9CLOT|nr:hypothetical protein psyc5s11_24100 [Clostridium gelidum]